MLWPRERRGPRAPLVRAWDEALLVRGEGGTSSAHAHHWWHLLIGLDAPLRASGPDGAWERAAAILAPPDLVHAIEAEGDVAILFVEPESRTGVRLSATCPQRALRALDDRDAAAIVDALSNEEPTVSVIEIVLDVLGAPDAAPLRVHPGITRVVRHLESAPPDADVSLEALAPIAGLSRDRFMHAFTEYVGLPLRPYVRWLRVRRAAAALLDGSSGAEAAHAAGFSDAAHMSRTFREMFGVTPSELSRRSQSVQSP